MKTNLLDLSYNELQQEIAKYDKSAFRAKQINQWLMKGASFDEMTNLSKSLRQSLKENYITGHAVIELKQVSSIDNTIKYLFRFHDDVLVEGVVMSYKFGKTLCMSTQAGCNMGCIFCASGADGKRRDLSQGDMLAQVIAANNDIGEERSLNNIVLMGSGEPFDNYDNTINFLRRLNSEDGLKIGWRSISLSTCGLVDKIEKFAQENMPITLCISLHAGLDETRKKIIPIANLYTIKETISAAKQYFDKTGRRIIIEYAMIDNLNDDRQNANALIKQIRQLNCNVNIIKLNDGPGGFKASSKNKIDEFMRVLNDNKIQVTLRRTMGADIEGACGQLKSAYDNSRV